MEDISSRDICDIFKNNMGEYAVAVNQFRAIPDARTGLKPIHKKILWEMYTDKIYHDGKYKKCAYMVGQVISRFSEHGDSATYEALVRLSQDWIQLYPLIDLHGNGGSQFGDPPAAMRYVEARLSEIAELGFFHGIENDAVNFSMNYTNEEKEPDTLPAVFPGLFCLPTQGIGYACASNFLTFNLTEVYDMISNYISTGNIKKIHYDLASGGTIVNPDNMEGIIATGQGNIIIDSVYQVHKQNIIFDEFPFNVMYDDIVDDIVNKIENGILQGIKDIQNTSGGGNLQLTVVCAKDTNPNDVAEMLLQSTKLRCQYAVNQTALVNGVPKLLSLKEMVDIYITHNVECIRREFEFDYNKTSDRLEIVNGLIKCMENIDLVVSIIRNSKNSESASVKLQEELSLTQCQAKAILDMRLSKLNALDADALLKEKDKLEKYLKKCDKIRSNEKEQKKILITRLSTLTEKYGSPRRTQVCQKDLSTKKITKKSCPLVIQLTDDGYLQRVKNPSSKNYVDAGSEDMLYLFSNKGKMFRIVASDVSDSAKGSAAGALVNMDSDERIMTIMNDKCEKIYVRSNDGYAKQVLFKELAGKVRNLKGTPYIKLNTGSFVETIRQSVDKDTADVMGKNTKGKRDDR